MSEITNNKKGTMLERATTCFLYAILCIFPLVFVHYYADILYVKYYFIGCDLRNSLFPQKWKGKVQSPDNCCGKAYAGFSFGSDDFHVPIRLFL